MIFSWLLIHQNMSEDPVHKQESH